MKLISLFFLFSFGSHAASISFFVKLNPAGSLEAETKEVNGRIAFKNGKVQSNKILVSVDSLKTGIELRDEHLKKHLNMKKYPYIYMYEIKGENNKGSGTIEISGVKSEINFNYKIIKKYIEASFIIDTRKFKLNKVKYFNIGVENIVKVKAILPLNNNQELL